MQTTARPRTTRRNAARRLGLGLALAALATAGVAGPSVAGAETPPFEPDFPIVLPEGPVGPPPTFPGPGDLTNPEDPGDPDPGPGVPGPGDLRNPERCEPGDPGCGPDQPGPEEPGPDQPNPGTDVLRDRPVVATPTFTG
jgi:hypothetical protein